MYPFCKKIGKKTYIKLHKGLYGKNLIERIKKEFPQDILSLKASKNYHLLELDIDGPEDYFDFCNYLIYYSRIS